VLVLRRAQRLLSVTVVILVDELPQVVLELGHPVGRDEDLEPRVAPGEGLRHLQEATPRVLLQVHVILLVVLVHHLGLQLTLSQIVRIQDFQITIEVDESDQVLTEEGSRRECHQNLILSPVSADLCDLDEPSPLVLLHIQVEPLALQHQSP